jgi:hypothetical protein
MLSRFFLKVFTAEARKFELRLDSISLGINQYDEELERAALQLIETETKVVLPSLLPPPSQCTSC